MPEDGNASGGGARAHLIARAGDAFAGAVPEYEEADEPGDNVETVQTKKMNQECGLLVSTTPELRIWAPAVI